MKKIIVFGNGGLWSLIKSKLDMRKYEIVAFINSDEKLRGSKFDNSIIITPNDVINYDYDLILLASSNIDAQIKQLPHVSKEKIVAYDITNSEYFNNLVIEMNSNIREYSNVKKIEEVMITKEDQFSICTMNRMTRDRRIDLIDTNTDFIRLSSLELVANEIYERNIQGNVAELGVYKGNFARKINEVFPNKTLYLFDTFEGFADKDVEFDITNKMSELTNNFSDTSVQQVLEKMPHKNLINVKKGYFPDTALNLEDRFCFVSIDTDLFKPVYEGLKYFYPRLEKGGYIFVHDYNNSIFNGAKLAVRQFCEENSVAYTPIPDRLGTVIISK